MFLGWSASPRLFTALPSIITKRINSAGRRCAVLSCHLSCARHSRPMSQSVSSSNNEEVVYSTDPGGGVATILLNRPKALNALNLNMLQLLIRDFKRAEADPAVKMVVLESKGIKAFCAGGDVRALTEARKVKDDDFPKNFFKTEYLFDYYTGVFPKPSVAIQDGITMGGGVGISVHGPFRVATEHTVFAMPETLLGLFPDVGGSYFLPRLRGSLGIYLALTGHRLEARDVVFAGIATHFIPHRQISALKERLSALCCAGGVLASASSSSHKKIVQVELDHFNLQNIQEFSQDKFSLEPHMDCINRCFNQSSVEDILAALEREGSEWATNHLQILSRMSPTSMKITYRQLMEGAKMSFADCFVMEYRMSLACMAGHDFYEGVRAILIDKDNKPKWSPATLEEVTPSIVHGHFIPRPEELKLD